MKLINEEDKGSADLLVTTKKPETLPEQIDDIRKKLDIVLDVKGGKLKDKSVKLKYSVRSQLKSMYKKNKIMVIALGGNRIINVQVADIKDGYVVVDGVPRKFDNWYTFLWEGKYPCVVLPKWKLEPYGIQEYEKNNPTGITIDAAVKMIYAVSKSNENLMKKPVNVKLVVFGILGAIALLWIFMGGQG